MQPGPFKGHVVLNFQAIPVRFFCGNHWMDFLKLSFGVGMRNSGWIWGCLVHPSSHSVAARSTKDSSERSCRARPRSRGKLGVFCGFSVVEIVFDRSRSRWPGTFGARFFSRKPGLG